MAINLSSITDPNRIASALRTGLDNTDTPTIIDVVVTRNPAQMLPAAANRTLTVKAGDRPL